MPLLDDFVMGLSMNAIPGNINYTGEIFHYTALRSIESILLNPQDKIILWASQFDCLNDMSEGTVVEQRYNEVCKCLKSEGQISDQLFDLLSNIKPSRNETFLIDINGKIKPYRGEYTTYIASFSKNNDLLPMWNYYSKGDLFEGINLGMDAGGIISSFPTFFADGKINVCISSVVYNKIEQEQIIKKFLLEIVDKYEKRFDSSVRAVVSMKLTSWKMLFKQECFSHEQEVRIIVKVVDKYKDVWPIKYRTNAGYIIPYIELPIDKYALKSVTLGPFHGSESQRRLQMGILEKMLASKQYDAKISISKVPVRY